MNQFGNFFPQFGRGGDPVTFLQGVISIVGVLGLILSAVLAFAGFGSSGSNTQPPSDPEGFVVNPLARAVEEAEARELFEGTNAEGTSNPYGSLEISDDAVDDAALVEGSVLSVVPTEFLPEGALLKIISVTDQAGDTTLVITAPATLSDIVENSDGYIQPEAQLYDLQILPEPGVELIDPIAEFYGDGEVTAIFQQGFKVNENIDGMDLEVEGNIGIDGELGYETSFGFVKEFDAAVTPFVRAGVTAEVGNELSAEWGKKLVSISATHQFMLGPVPVFLTTTGSLDVKLSAGVAGALSYSPAIELTHKVGLDYRDGSFSPINKPDVGIDGFSDLDISASGEVTAALVPKLKTKLYQLVGIDAEVSGWTELAAEFAPLSSECIASAGVTPALALNASVDLLNLSWTHTVLKEDFLLFTSDNLCPFQLPDPGVDPTPELAGGGVTLVDGQAGGSANQWGYLEGFVADKHAWVLSTGDINHAVGVPANNASTDLGNPGSPELSELSGGQTWDAATYRVTVVPTGSTLVVEYAFASEEYPEYVGSAYNDVMAVFVNGQNCAVVPETGEPISVNTVNMNLNSQYYVDNTQGAAAYNTSYDGLTKNLRCAVPVTPGVPVDVLIAVADTGDAILDSAVALVEGGIYSE